VNEQRRLESPEDQSSGKLITVLLIIVFILFGAVLVHVLDVGEP
jgi:hypothetical protein